MGSSACRRWSWRRCAAIIAALLIIPLGALILPGGIDLPTRRGSAFVLLLVAGALAGARSGS